MCYEEVKNVSKKVKKRSHLQLFLSILIVLVFTFGAVGMLSFSKGSELNSSFVGNNTSFYEVQKDEWLSSISQIDISSLLNHTHYLSNLGTRYTGYAGSYKAAEYIFNKFKEYGIPIVLYQPYNIAVPIDYGANITFVEKGEKVVLKAYPLLPNGIQVCNTPKDGLSGLAVYVKDGSWNYIDKQSIKGSIVIMDFNSYDNWLKVASLGAKGVIFIEPENTTSLQSSKKYLRVAPLYFPRLFVTKQDGERLLNAMKHNGSLVITIKSEMKWEKKVAYNVIGIVPGSDPTLKSLIVPFMAYYDSDSVVPSLSPGANEALGVSVLLELAKVIAKKPTSRTCMFVALSGHGQAIMGAKWFMHWLLWERPDLANFSSVGFYFDLSSDNNIIGVFYSGYAYNRAWQYGTISQFRDIYKRKFTGYVATMRDVWSDKYGKVWPIASNLSWEVRHWDSQIPVKFSSDSEVLTNVYVPHVDFRTAFTLYPYRFNPEDKFEKVSIDNIKPQIEFIYGSVFSLLEDPDLKSVDLNAIKTTTAVARKNNLEWQKKLNGIVVGQIVKYDVKTGWYTPIPNAIVESFPVIYEVFDNPWVFSIADQNGTFMIPGYITEEGILYTILPFSINYSNSRIEYAPDFGLYGASAFPNTFYVTSNIGFYGNYSSPARFVAFKPGGSLSILYPEASLSVAEKSPQVVPGPTFALVVYPTVLEVWSRTIATMQSALTQSNLIFYGFVGEPYVVVLFSKSEDPAVTQLFRMSGGGGVLLGGGSTGGGIGGESVSVVGTSSLGLALNSSLTDPEGYGYKLQGDTSQLGNLALSKDLITLNDYRMSVAKSTSVYIPAYIFHRDSEIFYNLSLTYLREKEYSKFWVTSQTAFYLALQSYNVIKNTLMDVVSSSTALYILLIPFAFLFERLVFSFDESKKQFIAITAVLVVLLSFFLLAHPAFRIASSSILILLGTTIGVLSTPVLLYILSSAVETLNEVRIARLGEHFFGVSRTSYTGSAMTLGIQNMRRRAFRTSLMLLTVIVLVASIVQFTSITPSAGISSFSLRGNAAYKGLMVRTAERDPLDAHWVDALKSYYSNNALVISRYWLYSIRTDVGITLFVDNQKPLSVKAMLGLEPSEDKITHVASFLKSGRFFTEHDLNVCIIPEQIQGVYKLKVGDTIYLWGRKLTIIGVLSQKANQIRNLDQSPAFGVLDIRQKQLGVFYAPSEILIVPAKLLKEIGGFVANVVLQPKDESFNLNTEAKLLAEGGNFVYLSTYENASNVDLEFYSPKGILSASGYTFSVPLIVIGSLVLLDAMLGNTFERTKEIKIYSAVGVSPSNISEMFLIESIEYAIIGALIGYIVGIIGLRLSLAIGLIPETFTPNFSSTAVIIALGIAILTVISSSIYPAYQSAKLITPSLERKWRLPSKPTGDQWEIPLPFVIFSEYKALALFGHLSEFFSLYDKEESGVPFVKVDLSFQKIQQDLYVLKSRIRLPPFAAGISQNVILELRGKEDKWYPLLKLSRVSGPYEQWIKINWNFINVIRKQFLIFESLSFKDYSRYYEKAKNILSSNVGS
jgi:ABC-type antimicrobial peptide transport system permease subunit